METHTIFFKPSILKNTATVSFCAMLLAAGCASRPKSPEPPMDLNEAFSRTGDQLQPDRWWTIFEDESLTQKVDQALKSNFTLLNAWHRLQEAQAVVARESAVFFPDLGLGIDLEATRQNGVEDEEIQVSLMSDYELDLWGKVRAEVSAESFDAKASLSDYKAAALSLSASVVVTWYRLMEAHVQQALVDRQIETNENVLKLLKARFGSGQVRTADILRQQQLLESTREQHHVIAGRLQVLRHQLAVLLGQLPQNGVSYSHRDLPEIPPLPATGLPAELIERRPDVQSAWYQLQSADSDVAAAIRDRFPQISLSASFSSRGNNSVDLFDDWWGSLAAGILAPLFDAGSRRAEVDRTQAVKQQRVNAYAQAVITALREVEDALVLEAQQELRVSSIAEQLRLAEQTVERLQHQYLNGAGNYIDVLNALESEQERRRDLLSARLELLEYRIALYRALAGGFDPERENAS